MNNKLIKDQIQLWLFYSLKYASILGVKLTFSNNTLKGGPTQVVEWLLSSLIDSHSPCFLPEILPICWLIVSTTPFLRFPESCTLFVHVAFASIILS